MKNYIWHFRKKVDRRNKQAMIDFLTKHPRYYTMNSWNRGTSYAHNVKIYNLPLTLEQKSKAYELLDVPEVRENINNCLRQFDKKYDYNWQATFNGRSEGYIVLVKGGKRLSPYKSYCQSCGQRNFQTVEESSDICGRCGERSRVNHIFYDIYTQPGQGVDMDKDFNEWSMYDLSLRVKLVCEFDKLVDQCLTNLVYMIENYKVDEEEYTIKETRKVLKKLKSSQETVS